MHCLEYAADVHFLKLQRMHNRVLCDIGKFERRTQVREMHMAYKLPNVCNYITNLRKKQAEVIQNHLNSNVPEIGQGEV
jgi:hypothetical protein